MQFNDSVAEKDRSMEISAYRLTLKNPALASIIDTVAAGNYTNPIKVPDGWYIVKIDRIFNDLITTQTQLQKVKHELERSIFKQKMDALSDMYVSDLMADQAPEIDRDTFREVVYYLNKTARYPDTFDRIALDTHLAAEVHSPADTGQGGYLDSVLVVGKSLHLTLKDFIDWYRPRMAYLKYPQDTEAGFIFAVQQTVWRMVRDFLLINKAHEFNLDQVEAVRKQVSWWRDKIVYNAVKSELLASVQFNEQDLVKFYDENLRDYRYADGNTIPFEKARKNVESDYVREKYMTMVMRKVLQLKREYDIGIDEQVLEKIVVQDEDDPGAIDFYAVKKGGLLPRQPYPTIDWEWQAWE
jgi:hypothetical protein